SCISSQLSSWVLHCKLPHMAAEAAQQAEESDGKNWDPDKLMPCPYDKNHQIRACRLSLPPYKNHPKLASELKTVLIMLANLVHKRELARHTETCENRMCVYTEDAGSTNGNWHVPVSTWVNPIVIEDWTKTRPPNNLGPSFRAPNTPPMVGLKDLICVSCRSRLKLNVGLLYDCMY
uniref:CHHC U11-48K-type domain-containing protein n=1 Tax=Amphiprion percula TaxID=161767 RepID=A0A3P8U4K5_AMPPE